MVSRRCLLAGAAVLFAGAKVVRAQDTIDQLCAELSGARSFKVRVQAAYLLARMDDPRVVVALTRALHNDSEALVREVAAKLLGKNPGGEPAANAARIALAHALHDRSAKVRRAAKGATEALDRKALSRTAPARGSAKRFRILVGQMGDKSNRASIFLRERMRREVMGQLRQFPNVSVAEPPDGPPTYILDGAIRKLSWESLRSEVQATCAIELILSGAGRGMLMVASGEASVQRSRLQYRPAQRAGLEEEAMMHAVRSAHENLSHFLSRQ